MILFLVCATVRFRPDARRNWSVFLALLLILGLLFSGRGWLLLIFVNVGGDEMVRLRLPGESGDSIALVHRVNLRFRAV